IDRRPPAIYSDAEQADDTEAGDPKLVLAAGTHLRLSRCPAIVVHAHPRSPRHRARAVGALVRCRARCCPGGGGSMVGRTSACDGPLPPPAPGPACPRPQHKSSGCSVRVHTSAHPAHARTGRSWVGRCEGVHLGTVVPLGAEYVTGTARELGFERRWCGGTMEGVECAVRQHPQCTAHAPCTPCPLLVHALHRLLL
ncbi:hypothetical protein FB451DRAFT_1507187, partial [Mycena latifolia]